jgi:uncharacterized protein YkwD
MARTIPTLILFSALMIPAFCQEPEVEGGAPSADFVRRANQWMMSTDVAKRKAAYLSWLQLGPEALPAYQKALETAKKHHSKQIDEIARGRSTIVNPYAAHHEVARQLDDERERVMELIKTDWKKDGDKIRMLREEMEGLEKLWEKVNKLTAADTSKFDAVMDGAVNGLAEVSRELERFDAEAETLEIEDEDLPGFLLRQNIEGEYLMKQRERMDLARAEIEQHQTVEKHNAELGRWASATMKDFVTLLNRERVISGLPAFKLEEKLSDACLGHSNDMARMGFFAHESPVPGKKSPWDRARLAGFDGSGAGENIFMGSTSHSAAYHAWFGSDGHRFIMFGGGNTVGVGVAGSHWTMMTGNHRGS